MDPRLFHFTCARKEINQLKKEYDLQVTIPDFKWILNNQTNREIRIDNIKLHQYENTEDCPCELKLQLSGIGNYFIRLFFRIKTPLRIRYSLNINQSTLFEKKDENEPKKLEWTLIGTLHKPNLLSHSRCDMQLAIKFIVCRLENNVKSEMNNFVHAAQEFESKFNAYYEDIIINLENLLTEKNCADITVKSNNGVEFQAHKCILASRSMVLKAHFEHNMKENQTNVLEMKFDPDVVDSMLQYIYTGRVMESSINESPRKLLEAADFYQLSGLKKMSENILKQQLCVENAIETLELAHTYNAKYLHTKTLLYISEGPAVEIIKTPGWKAIKTPEIIKSICEFIVLR